MKEWRPILGEAQNWRCCYCHHVMTESDDEADTAITVEHVIPRTFGGSSHWLNLVAACRRCNHGRGDSPMDPGITQEMFIEFLIDGRMLRPKYQIEADRMFGVVRSGRRKAERRPENLKSRRKKKRAA
ncbi:MAG: HNH endonuclease [Parvibaculum sp.]|nr:HNH endonuclease [Parvibaculum sp.]